MPILHTAGVTCSIHVSPTNENNYLRGFCYGKLPAQVHSKCKHRPLVGRSFLDLPIARPHHSGRSWRAPGLCGQGIPVTTFLTNFVGSCGSSRLNECADNLVAMADEEAANVALLA
jgi:hypothetical protein